MADFGDSDSQYDGFSRVRITIEKPLLGDQRSLLDQILEEHDLERGLTLDQSGTLWTASQANPCFDDLGGVHTPTAIFTYVREPHGFARRVRAARAAFRGEWMERDLETAFERHGYRLATANTEPGNRFGIARSPLTRPDVLTSAAEFFSVVSPIVRAHGGADSSAQLRYGPCLLELLSYRAQP
jgi:hypothetical protein